MQSRGKKAKGCDLFMSLHSNAAYSSSEVTDGSIHKNERVDRVDIYAPLTGRMHDLAKMLADKIVDVMETDQGGNVKTRKSSDGGEYYGVLRGAASVGVPGLLVEHSFHTNTRAAKWLLDESNLDKLAKAEAEVLAAYFGIKTPEESTHEDLTKIAGKSRATAAQMEAYIKMIKPETTQAVIDMIPIYLEEGAIEGIRGDIAFAQSCLETGNFLFRGSSVSPEQNNFCGMGVTGSGVKGNSFETPRMGIRAQIQHLKAYANDEPLKNECIDPRFTYVPRGVAPYVEWLGMQENPQGKGWAAGANYGSKILGILHDIENKRVEAGPVRKPVPEVFPTDGRILENTEPMMYGEDIRDLQKYLNAVGFNCGKADAWYGEKTEKAVKMFQQVNDLSVDGIAGPKTFGKINELLAEEQKLAPSIQITAGDTWNIRNEPKLNAKVIGRACKGETYEVIGKVHGEWQSILFNGKEAWIHENALK